MPFSGTGTFNRIYSWVTDQANGILVRADRMDTDTNDIASGLSNCMTRDGQSPPTAAIPMGSQKLTGLANGVAATDAVNYGQVFGAGGTYTSPIFLGTPDATGATAFLVPTATAGDSTTKAASTAFVQSVAMTAALPNQTGNSGKVVTTNGTAASWSALKTIGGASLLGSGDIVTGVSTVGSTVTANYTITGTTPTIYPTVTTAIGQCLTAPDATTLTKGLMYVIDNTAGGYPVGFRDNAGTLRGNAVAAGGFAQVWLDDNSTAAGSWRVTGTNLEPGLIGIDNTFSSTYASTVLKPFVALDANKSIHFVALASGFAAVAVDKTTGVVGTPVTVSATASMVPRTAFMVTSTTAMLFYSSSTGTLISVILSLSGATTLAVGTPSSTLTATGCGIEDFAGAPKIAQLSASTYLVSYATATGAGTTSVAAFTASGTTATLGTPADIIAENNVADSTTTYALTATTALVLYSSGAGAPYAVNAVVVSVSGTTCTVGTPVVASAGTLTNGSSTPASSTLLSATKAIIVTDNGTTSCAACAITISGTTVTSGAQLIVETGIGSGQVGYNNNSATRYNPHLWPIGANTAGLWYLDGSSLSRAVVLTESAGTVTAGTIAYKSISWASANSAGYGAILPQGTAEFCSVNETQANTAGWGLQLLTNKISGSAITSGATKPLRNIAQQSPATIAAARLSSGDYILLSSGVGTALAANCIPVFRSNGDAINYRGEVSCPSAGYAPAYPVANVSSNRVVLLGAQSYGTTVGTTTYQLRIISVEIAQ